MASSPEHGTSQDGHDGCGPHAARVRRLWKSIYATRLFDADECRSILELADRSGGWAPAPVIHRGNRVIRDFKRRAEHLILRDADLGVTPRERFLPFLDRAVVLARRIDREYLNVGIREIQAAQLIRYAPGGHYDWHPDAFDHGFRKMTVLCYLTDAASDGLLGGETSFAPPPLSYLASHRKYRPLLNLMNPRLFRWFPLVQPPRQGSAVIFDSLIHHKAHPVWSGTKTVLNVMFV